MAGSGAGRSGRRAWLVTGACCLAALPVGYAVLSWTGPGGSAGAVPPGADADADDWAVAEGFALDEDTSGYDFPTSIAFVPEPGPGPKDPLYFVTELRGRVKVVTNDRTVLTFAEGFFDLTPQEELPARGGEVGMAGLCLEPEHGYVFVSFNHQNRDGELRNRIVRFVTQPRRFATEPADWQAICPMLDGFPSGVSHLIGPMLVKDGLLHVSVGDSELPEESRNLHSPLGKILRMTLDGAPAPDNPHRVDDDPNRAINYVYASGFRNPFSLSAAHGRLFAGDNGPQLDRFVEITRARDHGYDGTNWSIGTNAVLAFPSASPTQTEFLPADSDLFPATYGDTFFCSLSGSPGDRPGRSSIALIRYDFETSRAADRPRPFLELRSSATRVLLALAFGPDGLYFTSLLPDTAGHSSVLRVSWAPGRGHRHVIGKDMSGPELVSHYGCSGCHDLHGDQPGRRGPTLMAGLEDRLQERLDSKEYLRRLDRLDERDAPAIVGGRPWRRRLRELSGRDRVRYWVERHLLDPRFDNAFAQMPNYGMPEEHARTLAAHLLDTGSRNSPGILRPLRRRLGRLLPAGRGELALLMLGLGVAATLLVRAVAGRLLRS